MFKKNNPVFKNRLLGVMEVYGYLRNAGDVQEYRSKIKRALKKPKRWVS